MKRKTIRLTLECDVPNNMTENKVRDLLELCLDDGYYESQDKDNEEDSRSRNLEKIDYSLYTQKEIKGIDEKDKNGV